MNYFQMQSLPMKKRPDANSTLDDMILTTTRSLLKIPPLDLELERDLAKLSLWRANEVLVKLKGEKR